MSDTFPTFLSFLGIAKEATPGTAVAATNFIPVTSLKPVDDQKYIEDKGIRGSFVDVYGEIPGKYNTAYDYDGDMFADTVGFPLAGLLGDVAVTGTAAPFQTEIALKNSGTGQPPTYTLSDYDAIDTRQFPGYVFSDLDFKFSADNLATISVKGLGLPALNNATKPVSSYSALPPIAGWTGAISIGGAVNDSVMECDVTIKRALTVINTVDNQKGPRNIFGGAVSVDGKLTIVAEDDSALLAYLNNTQPSLTVDYSAGPDTQVMLEMDKCAYTATTIDRGKDFVQMMVTFTALANSANAGPSGGLSPIKATLKNPVAAGTYA
jgi:hypothetical protein